MQLPQNTAVLRLPWNGRMLVVLKASLTVGMLESGAGTSKVDEKGFTRKGCNYASTTTNFQTGDLAGNVMLTQADSACANALHFAES